MAASILIPADEIHRDPACGGHCLRCPQELFFAMQNCASFSGEMQRSRLAN
jgi:hypothetical protein